MEFDNTFGDPLPLSNNDLKVEFISDGNFCIDPREYLPDLEPFDYDGHRFYLVGSSFSPDLSIPLHSFDPFDPMASEKVSTDLQKSGENAFNFNNFCDEMSAGNGCSNAANDRSFKPRTTMQLRSATNR